ncbi:MAG: M3 family oligoendopeptidase [Clostridia bacterium]|nr:M3 family oligoendopeptidase [Clostridia bacterium]
MKFSEMPYERPNGKELMERTEALAERIKNASGADGIIEIIKEYDKIRCGFFTQMEIAYIRNTVDTRDEFYDNEKNYYDEFMPEYEEKDHLFMLALAGSPYREELEKTISPVVFKNIELQLKGFDPKIIPLMQKENKLCSEYVKLNASATVQIDGKTLPLTKLGPYKQSDDRNVRREAYQKEGEFFDAHREEYDRLYDELVKVRDEQAKALGFDNFVPLGYIRQMRNCYDWEDVGRFRDQVVDVIVPVCDKIKEAQRKRIGVEKLKIYDDAYLFPDGNPKPHGEPDELLAAAKKMYNAMSAETAEFIDAMFDMDMFDLLAKEGKAPGGYCTSVDGYKMPFIFSNFNGTAADVDVLTHEAGHAFAFYTAAREIPFSMMRDPSLDACETHSMSMEFLTSDYHELFFKEDTKKYELSHAEDAITFLPYGCMVDHFQQIVYTHPEYTPEQRNRVWAELEQRYLPYLDNDGLPMYGRGARWQRQHHIYEMPFYYIEYCMAGTLALQFFSLWLSDKEEAWKKYVEFVRQGGTKTFIELAHDSGLYSPTDGGSICRIMDNISDWLDKKESE